jgi:hypothetical protein
MMSYSFARLGGRVAVAALALVTLAALESCGGDSTAAGTTKVSVLLTDAPGDIKAAVVTISEIDLQGSGGSHVLMNSPVTTNLLTLAHSTAQLVNGAVVPRGTYTQLRFVITGGYIEVENDGGGSSIFASSPNYSGLPVGAHVDGELQMPSFAESGLKVDLPSDGTTLGSDSKVYLVDFNVAQSFGQAAGASGKWVMHPVVKATDFELTGGLTVQLQADARLTLPMVNGVPLTLGDFKAEVAGSDATTAQQALASAGGGVFQVQFPFLAPGSYSVSFIAPAGVSFATNPVTPATVSVASGQTTTESFTLTSATVTP